MHLDLERRVLESENEDEILDVFMKERVPFCGLNLGPFGNDILQRVT
jgi:hypothetical protein